jgi:hypothetical protein
MKTKFLVFCIIGLALTGCATDMNDFEQYMHKLQASTSSASEYENAVALNNYATEQHLSYSLKIRKHSDSAVIGMDELDKVIGSELSVVISLSKNSSQAVWEPVDNSNIFVLLRE